MGLCLMRKSKHAYFLRGTAQWQWQCHWYFLFFIQLPPRYVTYTSYTEGYRAYCTFVITSVLMHMHPIPST